MKYLIFVLLVITLHAEDGMNLFSQKEKEWIKEHPVVRVGSEPDYAPWDFNVNGQPKGYSVDYINLLASKIGLKIRYVDDTWHNLVEKLKNKQVDILHTIFKNEDRNYILYSRPYKKVTVALYINKNNHNIKSIKDLNDQTISITKGDSAIQAIKRKYPHVKISETKTYAHALKEAAFNETDAAVVEPGVGNYLIKEYNIPNIEIVSEFDPIDLGVEYAFHFGIHKDNAILVSILNKAMKLPSSSEIKAIDDEWLTIETKTDYSLVWEILVVVFFIIATFTYYSRKLQKLVNKKTLQLQSLLESFDRNVIASRTDKNGTLTYVSDALCDISGFTKEEMLGKPHSILRHADMPKEAFRELWNTIKAGNVWHGEVKNRKKDGGYYWVDAVISPEYDDQNNLIGYSSIRQDITAQKELEILSASLEQKVQERTAALKQNNDLMNYVSHNANLGFWNFNPQVGDLHVNDVFVKMLGYDPDEVLMPGYEDEMFKPFKEGLAFWEKLLHPDDVGYTNRVITAHINGETDLYNVTYRMRKADGTWMWSTAIGRISKYNESGKPIKFDGVNMDIDELKRAQQLIAEKEEFVRTVVDSQEQIIITTDGVILHSVNKTFLEFFDVEKMEDFTKDYDCICDRFVIDLSGEYLQKKMGSLSWIEYIIQYPGATHKAVIMKNDERKIFSVSGAILPLEEGHVMSAVFTDITELEKIREEIELIHKHTTESIEYASLIQTALIPENELFASYFSDFFTIWKPKDVVGGDIYLFEELRNENECLLMVVDCTGHGVPGAFVTMLVKAIERQITARIKHSDEVVSPGNILKVFNRSMKHLLKQESMDSISNAGFDGAVFYYNKAEQIIKYAAAEIPLFYTNGENKIVTIKGSRQSVGYKKSDANFEFEEHSIAVHKGMQFFITTDGYLDQNGGEQGFPLGKKRFKTVLEENITKTMDEKKTILWDSLEEYQGNEERNDDITLVGIQI